MYENQTYEAILERMLNRVPGKLDKRPSSLIYDTHSSTSIELQNLYAELESLIQNSYGDTAAREFLVLIAKDRGLSPEPATKAVLKGEFTPTDIDVTGKRFNIGEVNYTVLEQSAPGQYQVQCEKEGEIGNQHFGTMIPMEYIDGLKTAQLTEILVPGEEEEDTESFRRRYLNSFNEQSFGGNRSAYLEAVRKINGVGDLKVTRLWNRDIRPAEMIPGEKVTEWYNAIIDGLDPEIAAWLSGVYTVAYERKLTVGGTVLITIVNSLDYGEASETLVKNVQQELDPEEEAGEGYGLAPIGHVVRVKSAEAVKVEIKSEVTFGDGYGWENTKTAIEEAVGSYLLELRKEWAGQTSIILRISQIETRILSVRGVLDISGTTINGQADNLMLTQYQIPVLGGVSS